MHPLKVFSKKEVIEEEIDICVKDEHPQKAPAPISFTEDGMQICANDEHSEKAFKPIVFTEEEINIILDPVGMTTPGISGAELKHKK